ncbi:transketolase family protein [Hespellia stercorisuis]|uniref:Transketolase n=1 Tax=Hespellia stercorisuis DSM 15480 TaxID=1121950 RepID=A0A1M6J8C5_9FIRM|nr:transketolase C-terminal domain-containing protein [Hespellia stercorisuis]SHJ42892.1 transketolase [Hespellia stercorisuis DSM 15480]
MNKITNRQVICDTLVRAAKTDKDITVLCSDSRGSASLTPFFKEYPEQSVEVGIAEQNLVSVSAGMAACGKKAFAASPASFLSTRSYEQAKIDVAYSKTNVTLIGISGGVSYGALGMSHHSCQDISAFCSLPDMRVYLPSDRFQTEKLIEALLKDELPAYVRVSRSATEDVYDENMSFELNKANVIGEGKDVTIVACGEMVPYAVAAAELLKAEGIEAGVIDMYCLKPMDEDAIVKAAGASKLLVTVEEHSIFGGLGSLVSQVTAEKCPTRVKQIALPDGHIITGTNKEVFTYYEMDAPGIAKQVKEALK